VAYRFKIGSYFCIFAYDDHADAAAKVFP
jgi:hypothetical protein